MKRPYTFALIAGIALGLSSCSSEAGNAPTDTASHDSVKLIRNATLKFDYAGKTILVDPMLSEKGELMSVLGVNKNPTVHLTMPVDSVIAGVDFVLTTHSHFDHFDKAASTALKNNVLMYIQPDDSVAFQNQYGYNNTKVIADSISTDGITIIRTSGVHGREELQVKMGQVSGYILKADNNPTVYVVGDCLYTDEILDNIKKYNADWVILNSGGAIVPVLSTEFGPILMNEKDVVALIQDSPAKCRFIAVHMEAVDHAQTTRSILRNEAIKTGIPNDRLLIPDDGETIEL